MTKGSSIAPAWWTVILMAGAVVASVAFVSCGPPETDRSTPAILGKEYPYQLYTHCGVRAAAFDEGRWWRANPPLDDGRGNPPAGWGNPFTRGVMVLQREDLAVFTSQSGQVVEFVPWPPGLSRDPCQ